jgi:hypothetical protein
MGRAMIPHQSTAASITNRADCTLLWASPWPNGCLQQIAANGFSTPQDVIAILLQGFVRHALDCSAVDPSKDTLNPA